MLGNKRGNEPTSGWVEKAINAFLYAFVVWLFMSAYTETMNPVRQIEYAVRDVACKLDGGFDWEAGANGCYKFPSRGLDNFKRAFGG